MSDGPRFSGDEIRSATYYVLKERGLWPDWQTFETGRAQITKWGEDHLTDLRNCLGNSVWRDGVRAMRMPVASADLVRVLGTGKLLTEFTLAPLGVSDRSLARVARLGPCRTLLSRCTITVSIIRRMATASSCEACFAWGSCLARTVSFVALLDPRTKG